MTTKKLDGVLVVTPAVEAELLQPLSDFEEHVVAIMADDIRRSTIWERRPVLAVDPEYVGADLDTRYLFGRPDLSPPQIIGVDIGGADDMTTFRIENPPLGVSISLADDISPAFLDMQRAFERLGDSARQGKSAALEFSRVYEPIRRAHKIETMGASELFWARRDRGMKRHGCYDGRMWRP